MTKGFIKLHRQLLEWEWYHDKDVCRLFLHGLLKANYTPTTYNGIEIREGQFLTSYQKLAKETGLSSKQVQRCCRVLERAHCWARQRVNERANAGTLITVVNWVKFQASLDDEGKRMVEKRAHERVDERATNKNIKKKRNKEIIPQYIVEQRDGSIEVTKASDEQIESLKRKIKNEQS